MTYVAQALLPVLFIAAQLDVVDVVRQLEAALDRRDIDAALALFAEGAIREGAGLCAPDPCTNRDTIRRDLERASAGTRTPVATEVAGETVTVRYEIRNPATQAAGIDRIISVSTYQIRADRIVRQTTRTDASDPQTGAFVAFQRAQAAAAAGMPRAGDADIAQSLWSGVLLLAAGLAIKKLQEVFA